MRSRKGLLIYPLKLGSWSKGLAALLLGIVIAGGALPARSFVSAAHELEAQVAPAQNSYANIVDRVAPAVVTVRSERRARAPRQFPFMDDPFFREFFGQRMPQQPEERRQQGMGSGVIVSADGTILTNHHVVDGAQEISIELPDRRTFTARVLGSDPPSDLAVLRIEATNLPVLALGDSDRVRVGDVVLAVGNPLGLGQTVTQGIISAKGRATGLSDGTFEDFLQTDAAINRGNSGGALVNANGELIGINSQILSPTGGNIGIGFAIPSNMARMVMEQLIRGGRVRRGQLGVGVQLVTSDIAASLGLTPVRGVIVNAVTPGSGAARAGIRVGDVIVAVDGQPIADTNALRNRIASTAPGTTVTLTVVRDGREQQLRATLGELVLEESRQAAPSIPERETGESSGFGITVTPLTPDLAARLGLEAGTQGVVVTRIDPAGAAAAAGILQADVIEQVNRQPVRTAAELRAAFQRAGTQPSLVLVNRRGQSLFLTLRPR